MAALTALALLVAPGAAAASGMLTWSQPASFTTTANGANPDHDAFGGTPWTYDAAPSATPATLTELPTYGTGLDGGLDAWSDTSGTLIGVNPTTSAISSGGDTFATGALVMRAAAAEDAALVWTSPYPSSEPVTISGTVSAADTGGNCGSGLGGDGGYEWTLAQGATTLQSGTSSATGTIASVPATVPAGATITLSISPTGAGLFGTYGVACGTANAALALEAPAVAPTVTLATPTADSVYVSPAQPTFSGTASTAFGDSSQVTVKIYSGSAVSGSPVQTLTTTETGGSFAVPSAPLTAGTYTAMVSQSDLASPPDVATSQVTFSVNTEGTGTGTGTGSGSGTSGAFVLSTPTPEPLTTATPTFIGSAPAANAGDPVSLILYSGAGTTGTVIRYLTGTIGAGGSFSFPISTALSDGLYTAVAAEAVSGTVAQTSPVEILVKVHAPALTLISPLAGGSSSDQPSFYGLAGDNPGDSSSVTVALYAGAVASGSPLGTLAVQRSGGGWIVTWPSKLALGLYTVVAVQTDDAGHTTITSPHTFLVVPAARSLIGAPVAVSQNGVGSVPIVCPARVNTPCQGTVTIITSGMLRPAGGRHKQKLTLFKKSFTAYGGTTLVVRGRLSSLVERTLRRLGHVQVAVTLSLSVSGAKASTYTASQRATIAR